MRRLALLSDIHGNLVALDAVLDDIRSTGVIELACLGDLVGYGPDPAGVIERVRSLGIETVAGNYDDGIGNRRGGCGCYYATDQARLDGEMSYVFTDAALDDRDHAWLAALSTQFRRNIGGIEILLTHGSPRKLNEYLLPDRTDEQLLRLAHDAHADLVCVGHVHIPYHRAITDADGRRVHYVSSGSVGKPKDGDPRACWVELVIGEEHEVRAHCVDDPAIAPCGAMASWVGTVVHRVGYDVEGVAARMRALGLPQTLADALLRA